jgi:hypothetical protein
MLQPFNVLRYEIGQKYASHYDAFDPAQYGPQKTQRVCCNFSCIRVVPFRYYKNSKIADYYKMYSYLLGRQSLYSIRHHLIFIVLVSWIQFVPLLISHIHYTLDCLQICFLFKKRNMFSVREKKYVFYLFAFCRQVVLYKLSSMSMELRELCEM